MAHLRELVLLVIDHDLAVAEDDVARVIATFVLIHRHQARASAAFKKLRNRLEVDGKIGITVEDKELLTEQRQRALQRPARTEQHRAIERILQRHAVRRAIAEIALHHLAQMPETKHRALDSLPAEERKLVFEERLARHRHENLRNLLGNGTQARRETARQNRNGGK